MLLVSHRKPIFLGGLCLILFILSLLLFKGWMASINDDMEIGISGETLPVEVENVEEKVPDKNIFLDGVTKGESEDGFYVEYRLERDRIRSQQLDLLKEIVDNPNSSSETRQEAQKRLLEITGRLEQEMQLENLMAAKGFSQAVVFIQQYNVMVVVNEPEITQAEAIQIADLVSNTTGHSLKDIIIIPQR